MHFRRVLLVFMASFGVEAPPGVSALRAPMIGHPWPRNSRRSRSRSTCRSAQAQVIEPIDIQILQQQLQAVRDLPRLNDDGNTEGRLRDDVLLDDVTREPSFRRLFTHETWSRYTGKTPLQRWAHNLAMWPHSIISRSIMPCVLAITAWALALTLLLPRLAPAVAARASSMWVPLSLQGTAMSLLLVFRTNNAYRRLEEAREQWGKLLMLLREVSVKTSASCSYEVSSQVCRYLCAFAWSLRDKLRDGEMRDDILQLLLSSEEIEWVTTQRSRPLAILTRLRRLFYAEHDAGTLSSHYHYLIDCDIKDLDSVVESCERLFSSPIPPNMARHGMRSLALWILAVPIVLTNSMPPQLVALWTGSTSYIFLGIDELGSQVR